MIRQHRRPAPVRDWWLKVSRQLDHRQLLKEIGVPTLICVIRQDAQAPADCSQDFAQAISGARLIIFKRARSPKENLYDGS